MNNILTFNKMIECVLAVLVILLLLLLMVCVTISNSSTTSGYMEIAIPGIPPRAPTIPNNLALGYGGAVPNYCEVEGKQWPLTYALDPVYQDLSEIPGMPNYNKGVCSYGRYNPYSQKCVIGVCDTILDDGPRAPTDSSSSFRSGMSATSPVNVFGPGTCPYNYNGTSMTFSAPDEDGSCNRTQIKIGNSCLNWPCSTSVNLKSGFDPYASCPYSTRGMPDYNLCAYNGII